jgi:hypothetical protein
MPRRNSSRDLNLGDFERTGRQDCANVISADDFYEAWRKLKGKHEASDADRLVDLVWGQWERDGMRPEWIAQQSGDFDGLDPNHCYDAWRSGWKGCAKRYVADWIKEWKAAREDDEGGRSNPPRSRKKRKVMARVNPYSASELESDITEGMARALWVTAYADFVENLDAGERRELDVSRAGPGEDWADVAPETPRTAYDAAAQLEDLFYRQNARTMGGLLELAMAADGKAKASSRYAELFGHYMAMEALGHGVSWFDDHKRFVVKFPHFEAMTGDGESLDWSPMSQKNPSRRRR